MTNLIVRINNVKLGNVKVPSEVTKTLKYSENEYEIDECFKVVREAISKKFGAEIASKKLWAWFPKSGSPLIVN